MRKNDLIRCIQLCINSYEGSHGKTKKILEDQQKHVLGNTEFYTGHISDVGYVVFRGSDKSKEAQKNAKNDLDKLIMEWKDWIQNFETKGIDIDGGEMHLGFYEDFIKTKKQCYSTIKRYKKIVITGHSKGACQAILLAYFAKKDYPNKFIDCVAVAPAKCMTKHYKDFMSEIYTIINSEDFVCKIPHFKFKHMGKIIRIGKRNPLFWAPIIRIGGAMRYHPPQDYLKEMKKYNKDIV